MSVYDPSPFVRLSGHPDNAAPPAASTPQSAAATSSAVIDPDLVGIYDDRRFRWGPDVTIEEKTQRIYDTWVADEKLKAAAEAASSSPHSPPAASATSAAPAAPAAPASDPRAPDPVPHDLPAFAAVPVRRRADGWTAERQRVFIQALAETACVAVAANAAGVTPRSAYRLRMRPGGEGFDAAWRRAQELGSHRLTSLAFDRAIRGTPRGVWHDGQRIGVEYVPSDRLLMFLLKHHDRMRYGNLSGFLPCDVPDPTLEARAALPDLLAGLADEAGPGDPSEQFRPLSPDGDYLNPAGPEL